MPQWAVNGGKSLSETEKAAAALQGATSGVQDAIETCVNAALNRAAKLACTIGSEAKTALKDALGRDVSDAELADFAKKGAQLKVMCMQHRRQYRGSSCMTPG